MSLFHADDNRPNFEDLGQTNGGTFWYARDFMKMLGYDNFPAFQKAINKAIGVCMAINAAVVENFVQVQRVIDGETVDDIKLSRFACYLVAVNGDVRKPEVAEAQAYFVTLAEAFRRYFVESVEALDRVHLREELSTNEKALSLTAADAGVYNFQYFQNAGYRGMYNMNLSDLKQLKGVLPGRSVLDFMGSEELAANLFRITQTKAKIENENITGQQSLEDAAYTVGQTVRRTMRELSGQRPEDLPTAEDIRDVRGKLQKTRREFDKLDGRKTQVATACQ